MKCCDIKAGNLNKKITFQEKTSVRKPTGGRTVSWSNTNTVRAMITPVNERERLLAETLQHRISHTIIVRYDSSLSLTEKVRIEFGTRYFAIKSVINMDEANTWYKIKAIESDEAAV